MTRRDVEKGDLVCLLGVVVLSDLDGIAGVHVIDVLHALDHSAAIDVQTGNDSFQQHVASTLFSA
jgi:hypothetical protein